MYHVFAGIFDDSQTSSQALSQFRFLDKAKEVSLIGLDRFDSETVKRLEGTIEDDDNPDISEPFTSTLAGAIGEFVENFQELDYPGVGKIIIAGRLADMFSIGRAAAGESSGGLISSFVDLGFTADQAKFYSDILLDGQIILFVTAPEDDASAINSVFSNYGALDTDTIPKNIFDI